MPIQYGQWLIPGQLIYARAYGNVSREVLESHNERLIQLLDQAEGLVHIILDASEIRQVAANLPETQRILTFRHHDSIGWIVHVTRNRLIMSLANVMARLTQANFRHFSTLDEAILFLCQHVQDLDWEALDDMVIPHQKVAC
jgi:hypothetical protein